MNLVKRLLSLNKLQSWKAFPIEQKKNFVVNFSTDLNIYAKVVMMF